MRMTVFAAGLLVAAAVSAAGPAGAADAGAGAAPGRAAGAAAAGEAAEPAPPVTWVLQAATGTAYQLHSRLVIEQDGEEDLDFSADYATRPFTSGAPYYSLRLGRWEGSAAWELETHHHLVTLVDGPPEVEAFSLTHGYNMNTLNRAWLLGGFVWRLGAGVVVTHPESVVRGKKFTGDGFAAGFYLSGVCGQAAIEKRLPLWGRLFLSLEGKATAAWARVPVADGSAEVPNYALHALAGLGYQF